MRTLLVVLMLVVATTFTTAGQLGALEAIQKAEALDGRAGFLGGSPQKGIGSSDELWQQTVGQVLSQPLWTTRDAYDSGHVLMVPLHTAFVAGDEEAIRAFEILFARFSRQEMPEGQLNQVQWLYLVSRYIALKVEFERPFTSADRYLVTRLANHLVARWRHLPSFQWERYPFVGAKARLDFVLSSEAPTSPSYYRAVIDYELFLFAIAADIRYVIDKGGQGLDIDIDGDTRATLDEILQYAVRVLRARGEFTEEGGWLFQRGIWTDHPDFRYSGHVELVPGLSPKKRPNVAEDSSHAHRWPLWLRSFYRALSACEDRALVAAVFEGFAQQFVTRVAVWDDELGYLRLNNFMDGWNGIYRYRYSTVGANDLLGYGPYMLSGILGESWYPFLGGPVQELYQRYSGSYPLPPEAIALYVGPNTTRERNPLYTWPDYFTNGFAELVARQSWFLSERYPPDLSGPCRVWMPVVQSQAVR